MDIQNLVKALSVYDVRKRILAPERYVKYDLFQNCFPELFASGGPFGNPAAGPATALMQKLLAGENISDDEMRSILGFTGAELDAAMKAADPVVKPVPEKLVLMTYDDATIDHYERACPVLEQYGGHANLMICEMEKGMRGENFADKSKFMTWEQIKELSDRGHEICNHSWHHSSEFSRKGPEFVLQEARGIEEKCREYGIPNPITFGYPIGRCTPEVEETLRAEGYLWGRGDYREVSPELKGNTLYDPHIDTPMCIPGVMFMDESSIISALNQARDGRVALTVYHDVAEQFGPMSYEDQVKCIYDNGGRCVTFRELMEYIDPNKAYEYTHTAAPLPDLGPGGPPPAE